MICTEPRITSVAEYRHAIGAVREVLGKLVEGIDETGTTMFARHRQADEVARRLTVHHVAAVCGDSFRCAVAQHIFDQTGWPVYVNGRDAAIAATEVSDQTWADVLTASEGYVELPVPVRWFIGRFDSGVYPHLVRCDVTPVEVSA